MALFKCKICGGGLEITNEAVVTCEYCGTQQTLPRLDNDRKINLYDRANHFRRNNEFDKAAGIYEQILNEDTTDAEAYWSLVLCRYGIEYVEDPATHKRLPTVNRTQFTAVFDDDNYTSALQYATLEQRKVYEAEAKRINEIQKNILAVSQKEAPFDVFICYKETDNHGRRTPDSVLANDLYHQLTQEGFRVFFSRITLEDKLGTAYEPYIFAALNSAKVMVVLGTKPEHFKAVWVKNEWSRYLAQVKASNGQKVLIPAYKDMDPYDLPEEFSHLQAQDMSKLGFMQDLIRGIKKLTAANTPKPTVVKEAVVTETGVNIAPLLKRAFMFLEDGDWAAADEYCEKVLDQEPQNAQAYLGKLMAQLKVKNQETLKDCSQPFDGNNNYQKVLRFGDAKLVAELKETVDYINTRNENNRLEGIYSNAKRKMLVKTEKAYLKAAELFETIPKYKDAVILAMECRKLAEVARQEAIYTQALNKAHRNAYLAAAELFETIPQHKDAAERAKECREEEHRKIMGMLKLFVMTTVILVMIIVFGGILRTVIVPNSQYKDAIALMENGKYSNAISLFSKLGNHKDSKAKIAECNDLQYNDAVALMENGEYSDAISIFSELGDHKDSEVQIKECTYRSALANMEAAEYDQAVSNFDALGDYKDSEDKIVECKLNLKYDAAMDLLEKGDKDGAAIAFAKISNLKDAKEQSAALWAEVAVRETVSAGTVHTVGLKADGTVVATGNNEFGQCDVSDWSDIVAISAGHQHTIGLKADGTVVATGNNEFDQCNVSKWSDIVAISAGGWFTIGLKADGTVVATGNNEFDQCNVSKWSDIVAISAGWQYTTGMMANGTVVAVGTNVNYQCNVSKWSDIVAISAGDDHTVGLKTDGTVVATGSNNDGQRDGVSDWTDIVDINGATFHTVGLKTDGTVLAIGNNDDGQCNVFDWSDIVAISTDYKHTVGLKADGTVVATGNNDDGQCDVSDWTNIKLP